MSETPPITPEEVPPEGTPPEAAEPAPKRSVGRRLARFALITGGIGLGVLGIVVVGVGGGVFWLTTKSGNEFIRQQALEQAGPFIPEGKLAIEGVDTNLFGHIHLKGLSISTPGGKPMVSAAEVRLKYDLSHILDTRVDITEVALIDPIVDVEVLPDGNIDIAAAFGPSEPTPPDTSPPAAWIDIPADIRVAKVLLKNGKVRYRDASNPEAPMDVQMGGLELRGAANVNQKKAGLTGVHLGLASLDGLDLDLPLPLSLDADLLYDDTRLNVEKLALVARKTAIDISGHIERVDFDDRVLALKVDRLDLDEGDIEALAGDDVLLGGLGLTGTIDGPLSDLSAKLKATTTGGALEVDAWTNTSAQPLAWKVGLSTPSLDVDRVTPLVPQPTHLNLELSAEGQGTDPSSDLKGSFKLTSRDQVVFNERLPELRLGGRIDSGVVRVEELAAVHSVARLNARGSIDLNNEIVQLDSVSAKVPNLTALAKYGAAGLSGSFGYDGRVRVEGFGEGGVVLAEGNLDLTGFAAQDAVSVQALNGPVQARVDLDTTAVQASGRTAVRGVTAPSTSIGGVDLNWQAKVIGSTVMAETTLDLTALSIGDGAVSIDRISTPEGRLFRGGVDGTGEPWAVGRLFMTEMGFGTAGNKADGGEISLAFRDPDGERGPDSARLQVGFDLNRSGDASFFEGKVSGDLVSGEWRIDDLVIAPTEDNPLVAEGPVTFKLADGGARDISASLKSDAGSIQAMGNWVPDSEDASTLELVVDKVDLTHVAKMAQFFVAPEKKDGPKFLEGLAGIASLSVKLDDAPDRDLVVDAVADLDNITYPGAVRHLFLDAKVNGPITRPQVNAKLAGENQQLLFALTGSVPLEIVEGAPQLDCSRTADLDAIVAPGNIQRFSQTLPAAGDLPEVQASAAILVGGKACDPDLTLVASASAPVGMQGQRARVDLDVHRKEGLLDIEGGVDFGMRRRIAIDGSATTNLASVFEGAFGGGEMPPTDQLSTFASAIDLSVVPLGLPIQELSIFAEIPRGITGRISGGINISGQSSDPTITGGLLWTEASLGEVGLDVASFLLLPVDDGYLLDGDLVFSTGGSLLIDGHVPIEVDLDSGGEIDLERPGFQIDINGDGVPMEALEGVVEGFSDAGGRVSLSGGLGGTLAAPVPTFNIGIADGHFVLRDTRLKYHHLNMNASLSRSSFKLDDFTITAETWSGIDLTGQGPLKVSGEVGLSDSFAPTTVDFLIRADEFWVADRKDLRLKISGDKRIKVTGTYPEIKVRGGIAIDDGRLTLDESVFLPVSNLALDPLLVVHRKDTEYVQGRATLNADGDDITQHLDVDIGVNMSKPFRLAVTMPMGASMGSVGASLSTATVDLDVTSPGLDVGMKKGDISLVGDVEMGRGDLDFFGSSFDIGGGKLTFTGKNYTDPVLELQAVRHTGRYGDVAANISGTATDFNVEFQSDDYPDQTDILSILLFGKPASELGDSEGQSGGSQLGAALAMAAGSQVNQALGSTLGGQIEFDQGAVKAGVPLSDKWFLSIERHSNVDEDENVFAVALEWLITRQMYAEVVTGDAGQSSGDLYMRWRF